MFIKSTNSKNKQRVNLKEVLFYGKWKDNFLIFRRSSYAATTWEYDNEEERDKDLNMIDQKALDIEC